MEDTQEAITLKITNHLTGEISEVTVKTLNEAKNNYIEIAASLRALDGMKKRLASWMDEQLGNEDEYKFADGKILRRVSRETKVWTREGLQEIGLDEDAIASVSTINMTSARAVVKEMLERGDVPPNAGRILDDNADVKATKPFVEIR